MAENENNAKPSIDDKYGKLDKDLILLLKNYEYEYFRLNKPIPFCGLLIYPIPVKYYEEFANCCSCLTLNKNEDPQGIRYSHLDYLVSKMKIEENGEGKLWSQKLQRLFELIFRINNGVKCTNTDCNHVITYDGEELRNYIQTYNDAYKKAQEDGGKFTPPQLKCPECGGTEFSEMIKIVPDPKTQKNAFMVDGHLITRDDWVKLRQIVLYQNYPDYVDDSWVDPAVRKDHEEKLRLQQQKQDLHASIEKKVTCLVAATNYKFDELYEMSIRRFTMLLSTVDDLINYKIMKQAVMSGFVTLPKGQTIEHWIWKPIKDIYGDSYKDKDDVQEL